MKREFATMMAVMMMFAPAGTVLPWEQQNLEPLPAHAQEPTVYEDFQYRAQLKTLIELQMYDAFVQMKENGDLQKGTARFPLNVAQEILQDYLAGDAALMQYFQNARDAFMMDSSDVFYVDWTKMTLRVGRDENGTCYAFLGNGPYADFFCDNGCQDEAEVQEAIAEVEAAADAIIEQASGKETEAEKIACVHDALIEKGHYLEPGDFSTFHGSNVTGLLLHDEAWCEGYSRAFQYVMQRMDMDCILVIGGGIPGGGENGGTLFSPTVEEHMWNYVRLSDGSWYGVDVTYDDPIVHTPTGIKETVSDKYLLRGETGFMASHIPSGQFSQGGREFTYPTLRRDDYGQNSGVQLTFRTEYVDFPEMSYGYNKIYPTFTDENGKVLRGKEIPDAGYYFAIRDVLVHDDGTQSYGKWCDISRTGFDYDDSSCFYGFAVYDPSKAVTLVAYETAIVRNAPDSKNAPTQWAGEMDFVIRSEPVWLRLMYVESRASQVRKVYQDPPASAPIQDQQRKVTARFDAPLELIDPESAPTLSISTDLYGASCRVEQFRWQNLEEDGQPFCEVSFDFYPDTSMNYSGTVYTFHLGNLKSAQDGTLPPDIKVQWAKPLPAVIPCVRTPSPSMLTVPIQPRLLRTEVSPELFSDPKGNLIGTGSSALNISLIASRPSAAEQAQLNEALDLPDAVEYAAYDLSLGCSVLKTALQYHSANGTKVTLALPYPQGFDSRRMEGVSYEAYHFRQNADGSYTKERLICNATETGIFIMADSFSPFMVAAVPQESHQSDGIRCLSVMADERMTAVSAADGAGIALDPQLISLAEGETCTVTFTPAEGYSMEQLVQSGTVLELPQLAEGAYTMTFSWEDLAESNSLYASFCADSVAALEQAAGLTPAEPAAYDPAVCSNNDQPVPEPLAETPVQHITEASPDAAVLTLPLEGVTGDPAGLVAELIGSGTIFCYADETRPFAELLQGVLHVTGGTPECPFASPKALLEERGTTWCAEALTVTCGGKTLPVAPTICAGLRGDVTLDGKVDASDAAVILQYAARIGAGMEAVLREDPMQDQLALFLGDVDAGTGQQLDASDAANILTYAALFGSTGNTPDWETEILHRQAG